MHGEDDVAALGAAMEAVLDRQKEAARDEGIPSAKTRIQRINKAIGLLIDYRDEITEALRQDFGHRSVEQSMMTDIYGSVMSLKYARKNVRRWMKPDRRSPMFPLGLMGARAEVRYEPKGTVGVISPWNFPINLTFAPLASIFAAGNRAMIKPSELTPNCSALMERMFRSVYDETEVAVFTGGQMVGRVFSSLPFDHLLFTGSGHVGRKVMEAAAANLVPVTLELGGKSPCVITPSADLDQAAQRIMMGKLLNAGQVCLSGDYVIVQEDMADALVEKLEAAVAGMYPTLRDNPDYTSIVNEGHFDRLAAHVDDAVSRGARLVEINPAREDFSDQDHFKIPPILLTGVSDDMTVMQDEIFGPLLPILTVPSLEDAVRYINAHDTPLALYVFAKSAREREYVLSRTRSGGVTVNDTIFHISVDDLPFGGVGPSGMGYYHGIEGFREFSHARSIYHQSWADPAKLFRPPYGASMRRAMGMMLKR